ncbi:MAG: flavin reductase family protein [Armatimonadota bacterium]|nr:flavin reductase family protein [Armatimonadota bacterium]
MASDSSEKVSVPAATRYFAPSGTFLITCGTGEAANVMTASAVSIACIDPPMLGVAIGHSRHSHGLLVQCGEFVVNVPDVALLEAVRICGSRSGRDTDKFALSGLHAEPSLQVAVPSIRECPLNIECVVEDSLDLGSHQWFAGRIVAVRADRELLDENGTVAAERLDPILTVFQEYWTAGRFLEAH